MKDSSIASRAEEQDENLASKASEQEKNGKKDPTQEVIITGVREREFKHAEPPSKATDVPGYKEESTKVERKAPEGKVKEPKRE